MPPKKQLLRNLEERTEKHPQLRGKQLAEVSPAVVAAVLAGARFVASGSFCRVWRVDRWGAGPAAARGQAVAIKVSSASFKPGLSEEDRRNKQYQLQRHWYRELNAHLLLEGQPRVVQVFASFKGSMVVPPVPGDPLQEPQTVEVVGLVEELCNQTSLSTFLYHAQRMGQERAIWPLHHLGSEFAALMTQIAEMDRIGICHQDIKLENIMVHLPSPPASSFPVLKLGDLNGAQWIELSLDGSSWIGTVGFMPYRMRRLYLGLQATAEGAGEVNYDTYQMGKTLLRALLHRNHVYPHYPRGSSGEEGMAAEDAEVKASAIQLLSSPPPLGQPEMELWVFGVAIGLEMTWDHHYTSAADQLRITPGEAAEALQEWARLCKAWQVGGSAAFWASASQRRSLARLYLRLAELGRVPPMGEPRDAAVHTQTDEFILEVFENFWHYGSAPEERLGPIKEQVAAILAERRAQAEAAAAAAAAAALAAAQPAKPSGAAGRGSWRSTAWEQKLAGRAEEEAAWLEGGGGSSSSAEAENRLPQKRKRPAIAVAAAKKPRAAKPAAAQPPVAAAPAAAAGGGGGEAAGGGGGGQGDLVVLSSKLTLKAVYGSAKPPAHGPQLLGDKHAAAVMLADTLRAAAAARGLGGGADAVRLRLSKHSSVTFHLAARRSVQFGRAEFVALASDAAGCKAWNRFVAAALGAWQAGGREASEAERLRLLRPLLAAA